MHPEPVTVVNRHLPVLLRIPATLQPSDMVLRIGALHPDLPVPLPLHPIVRYLDQVIDYAFKAWLWHAGCQHWKVSSVIPFASAQAWLQYFLRRSKHNYKQAGAFRRGSHKELLRFERILSLRANFVWGTCSFERLGTRAAHSSTVTLAHNHSITPAQATIWFVLLTCPNLRHRLSSPTCASNIPSGRFHSTRCAALPQRAAVGKLAVVPE